MARYEITENVQVYTSYDIYVEDNMTVYHCMMPLSQYMENTAISMLKVQSRIKFTNVLPYCIQPLSLEDL